MKIIRIASYIESPPRMSENILSIVSDCIRLPRLKERLEKILYRKKTYESHMSLEKDNERISNIYQGWIDSVIKEEIEIRGEFSKLNITPESLEPSTVIDTPIYLDFNGWKYSSLLEKCRKTNSDNFNKVIEEMSPITLRIAFKNIGAKGYWLKKDNLLCISVCSGLASKYFDTEEEDETFLIDTIKSTIDHELVHVAQDLFKKLNINFGNPSKSISNPQIAYSFPDEKSHDDRIARYNEVVKDMEKNNLDPNSIHALTDIEFYTNLISDVESFKYRAKGLNKEDRSLLFDLWIGKKELTLNELGDYHFLKWADDSLTYEDLPFRKDKYSFSSICKLKKGNLKKWEKAVNEFYKAVKEFI